MLDFTTFPIKFKNRHDFNKALKFVSDRQNQFDVGHSDMVINFFSQGNKDEMLHLFSILGIDTLS